MTIVKINRVVTHRFLGEKLISQKYKWYKRIYFNSLQIVQFKYSYVVFIVEFTIV